MILVPPRPAGRPAAYRGLSWNQFARRAGELVEQDEVHRVGPEQGSGGRAPLLAPVGEPIGHGDQPMGES